MKYKEISFQDNNSRRIYLEYMKRVQRVVKGLSGDGQQEILMEINSHIYESVVAEAGEVGRTELERLLDSLEKLGQPEVFLKPMVADKKMEEASRTFNPLKIMKALVLNIGNGLSYIVFAVLYILLSGFLFLIIAKIIDPVHVGLFYKPGDLFVLGRYHASGISYAEYEQLGNWFVPVMLFAALLFYIIITLLLRLKRTFKQIQKQ